MNSLEKRILRLIPIGGERPISGREIASLVNVSRRAVKDNINRLIIKYQIPIVAKRATPSGYFIPKDDTERLEGVREFRAQHRSEGQRLDTLISASLTDWKEYINHDEPIES
ncbi:HTH domain-containing protein [Streptococcus pluranimalium]|uniref:HTH domain-containing protein n=1 Tax=Streptococcus pluranimalium TaxID=82348 RepID=UPI0039FD0DB6